MRMHLGAKASRFDDDLKAILPRLRRHGLALTRNHHAMEDLVQETVMRALAAQESFQPGTNFGGWMNTILRNEFVSGIRRTRPVVPLDDVADEFVAVAPSHDDRLMVRELAVAMNRLPPGQREVILLSALTELNHAQIGEVVGCRPGTVKSRISRARSQLHDDLMGVAMSDENVAQPNRMRSSRRASASGRPVTGLLQPRPRIAPVMQMAFA